MGGERHATKTVLVLLLGAVVAGQQVRPQITRIGPSLRSLPRWLKSCFLSSCSGEDRGDRVAGVEVGGVVRCVGVVHVGHRRAAHRCQEVGRSTYWILRSWRTTRCGLKGGRRTK